MMVTRLGKSCHVLIVPSVQCPIVTIKTHFKTHSDKISTSTCIYNVSCTSTCTDDTVLYVLQATIIIIEINISS